MAAATSLLQEETQPVRRKRRTHAKVRTGCLTCKIRKKKCDETKPACVRCTSTGRKCDGYTDYSLQTICSDGQRMDQCPMVFLEDQRPTKRLKAEQLFPSSFLRGSPVSRSMSVFSFPSDIESQCFDYFRHATGPQFSSYFDSAIWRGFVMQCATFEPAVMQAAAAVGAAHRRFGFGITREAFEYCAAADALNRKAIKGLQELSNSETCHNREVVALTKFLLSLFEAFQSNYDRCVGYLTSGLKHLLDRPVRVLHSESQYRRAPVKPSTFHHLFHRLYCRAVELFDTEINIMSYYRHGDILPEIPDHFESLDQARDFIFTEVEWILHAPMRLWQDDAERFRVQDLHVTRMLKWSVTYAETVRYMPNRSSREKQACILLKLVRNVAYLLLYLTLFLFADDTHSQTPEIDFGVEHEDSENQGLAYASQVLWQLIERREELNTNLTRVSVLAESVLDQNWCYEEHSVCFDSGIGPPRLPEPDGGNSSAKTRHLVKSLLNKERAHDDQLWDILGVYGIAERLSAIEEHAVIAALQQTIIPRHVDPRWVDVTCFIEQKQVLLRYCCPDECGFGLRWTQQWLELC